MQKIPAISMKQWVFGGLLGVCTGFYTPAQAQLLAVNAPPIAATTTSPSADWVFFTDTERQILYIDFEQINVNLNAVSIKNAAGEIVFKDDELWQLPVNTIYEIDLSRYAKGHYVVELKTFTAALKKEIDVR